MKDPYNGPMINTSTNPRKTASGAQGSGQQGIDGSGRDADE